MTTAQRAVIHSSAAKLRLQSNGLMEVRVESVAEPMLLDRYLPQYDVTETHAVIVEASTDATWHA